MSSDNDIIDRLIDDAARQMTAGEPGAAFRAQVMDRLNAPRRSWWRSPWLLSPAAVAALVLIALAVVRRGPGAPAERAMLPSRSIAAVAALVAQEPAPAVARAGDTSAVSGPRQPARAGLASAVAALAPPLLEVPSIALDRIAPAESIQVPELDTISPIALA